jgi:hypothetical protein
VSTPDGAPAQDVPPEALSGTPSLLGRLLRFSQRISGRVEDLHVRDAEQQLYADCETLADLGEVTAKWAKGEIKYHPGGYDEGPAEETIELIPALVTLNRAGFITQCSQPGEGPVDGYDGRVWWQRAAVDGFTDSATADRLEGACEEADLIFIRNGPARRWRVTWKHTEPVTASPVDNDDIAAASSYYVHTHFGAHLSRRAVKFSFDDCASKALCSAEQVSIIDPVWGRKDFMWDTLTSAVTPPCCPCNERH